jgi:hypothetical protein
MREEPFLAEQKRIQDLVQAIIASDMKTNAALNVQAGNPGSAQSSAGSFKGPEGFGNVVGVGANPVIEAMNAQLEAAQETNAILREIANGGGASTDFTKANSSPSRASLLIR